VAGSSKLSQVWEDKPVRMINQFDPSVADSGEFDPHIANPGGGVYLFNESNCWLQLELPDGSQVGLPAWWSRFYRLDAVNAAIKWLKLATIATLASPLSNVYGETYELNEVEGRSFYDGPIPRNPYIANAVNSNMSTNQVVNDGNPATSTVVESTQTGNTGGSNLFAGNDGSFYYAQWIAGVYTKYLQGVVGANPAIVLGAKTFLQSYDQAGANLSSIFGIDNVGNTFIQSHSTNNQLVIYDKSGNVLTTFDANNCQNIVGSTQQVNGDTSGTMYVIEAWSGIIKIVIVLHNNYKNVGTGKTIALKNPFTSTATIFNIGCGGLQFDLGGVAQGCMVMRTFGTGTGAGTSTTATQMNSLNIGSVGGFDTVADAGSYAGAHSGICILIGQ